MVVQSRSARFSEALGQCMTSTSDRHDENNNNDDNDHDHDNQTWHAPTGAVPRRAAREGLRRAADWMEAGGLEAQFAVRQTGGTRLACTVACATATGLFGVGRTCRDASALAHGLHGALVRWDAALGVFLAWVRVMLRAKSVVRALPPFLPSSALPASCFFTLPQPALSSCGAPIYRPPLPPNTRFVLRASAAAAGTCPSDWPARRTLLSFSATASAARDSLARAVPWEQATTVRLRCIPTAPPRHRHHHHHHHRHRRY
jgi:hypothetical protein